MPYQYAILTTEQMQAADAYTIAQGVNAYALMKNAGSAAAKFIQNQWPNGGFVVLCGPGNNGGDGYVIATQLHALGRQVRVMSLYNQATSSSETQAHRSQCTVTIESLDITALLKADVIIDAIFGMGLDRDLPASLVNLIALINKNQKIVCAVDIPTGIDGMGRFFSPYALQAKATVSFFRKKPAHVLQPSQAVCGEVHIKQIGIDSTVINAGHTLFENHPLLWKKDLPRLQAQTHKYSRGQALIFGGTYMTGAARLSALACARAGAGATSLACYHSVWSIYANSLLSVMVKSWSDLQEAIEIIKGSYGAVLIGPGAGRTTELMTLVLKILQHSIATVVLDADALSLFINQPKLLFEQIKKSEAVVILTPHEGEFARLFPDLALEVCSLNKIQRARQAAQRSQAIVVLKGSDTVIAHPNSETVVQSQSTPYLATAGSGDVLAGMVTGLAAQYMSPFAAACAAVWLHSQSALEFGPGLIAEDLVQRVPKAWQQLFSEN